MVREYDGDAERVWTQAQNGRDLRARLEALPSFGDMKVRSMLGILSKRYRLQLPGLEAVAPKHPTLGDVDSPEALRSTRRPSARTRRQMRAAEAARK